MSAPSPQAARDPPWLQGCVTAQVVRHNRQRPYPWLVSSRCSATAWQSSSTDRQIEQGRPLSPRRHVRARSQRRTKARENVISFPLPPHTSTADASPSCKRRLTESGCSPSCSAASRRVHLSPVFIDLVALRALLLTTLNAGSNLGVCCGRFARAVHFPRGNYPERVPAGRIGVDVIEIEQRSLAVVLASCRRCASPTPRVERVVHTA